MSSLYSTNVTVNNRAPLYNSSHSYAPLEIRLNDVRTISIPPFYDPDSSPVNVTIKDHHAKPVSIQINAAQNQFSISPKDFLEVGTHILSIILSDGNLE